MNAADRFTRLVHGVLTTGIAPASFYSTARTPVRAHFDGLPVDFVARAITALHTHADNRFRAYHVVNPHDDGINLDSFIDPPASPTAKSLLLLLISSSSMPTTCSSVDSCEPPEDAQTL